MWRWKKPSFTCRSFYNSELQHRPQLLQYRCVNIHGTYIWIYEMIVLLAKILPFAVFSRNFLNSKYWFHKKMFPDKIIKSCALRPIHTKFANNFFTYCLILWVNLKSIFLWLQNWGWLRVSNISNIKYLSNIIDLLKNRWKAQYTIHAPIQSVHDAVQH